MLQTIIPTCQMPACYIAYILQQNGGDGLIRQLQKGESPVTVKEIEPFSNIKDEWVKVQLALQARHPEETNGH